MKSNKNLIKGNTGLWELVIGLEIHAQIVSESKLFSRTATEYGNEQNTQVSFIDAGFPGMLPVINETCVKQAIKTGLGLNAKINLISNFDRKNYFYPDLPQGYQISQFTTPIVENGYVDIETNDKETKRIRINRLHLEQDAGKSIHDQVDGESLIDLNRSGIALMEIVSEPDINSIEEAQLYVKKIRSILRCLGTCDGNMEQGSLRADVNISLHKPDEPLGTRAEIKNVNSIKFIGQAITYEVERQLNILENGKSVTQETRLFDPTQGITKPMRSKEDAHDYRYFPDPDLPPLKIEQETIDIITKSMPELPAQKAERYKNDFSLSSYDANVLTAEIEISHFFENAIKNLKLLYTTTQPKDIKLLVNWLTVELFGMINKENLTIEESKISPKDLAELVALILQDVISGKIAKTVFALMWETNKNAHTVVQEHNLEQISDDAAIETIIDDLLNKNNEKVVEYKSGKEKLFGFFVGQVMKAMKGKANPKTVNNILKEKLNSSQ